MGYPVHAWLLPEAEPGVWDKAVQEQAPRDLGDKIMNKQWLGLIALATLPGLAGAQDSDDVDWKIAPYLWMVGIDGSAVVAGYEQDLDVSFSDILDDFDVGGSVYAEVGKGHHAVSFDYTYLRLKPDDTPLPSPPTPPGSTMSPKMTTNIFEAAYNYRFDGLNSTALVGGARYLDIALRLTPNINEPDVPIEPPIPAEPVEFGPSWWDAFVGVKTYNAISANWDFEFYGTVGFGESDWPWTVQAMFGRRFSNDNRLGLGFRAWGIDYSDSNGFMGEYAEIDVTFYGFMVGYEFN